MTDMELVTIEGEINSRYVTISKARDAYMDKKIEEDGWNNFQKHWKAANNNPKMNQLWSEIIQMQARIIREIPHELMSFDNEKSTGDQFTIEDFAEDVRCGGFVDSDGSGYLMYDGKRVLNVPFSPSLMIKLTDADLSRYSGVDWYNK